MVMIEVLNDGITKVIIPIIVAIISLATPLMFNSIVQLDNKYHSTRINKRFRRSKIYNWVLFILGFTIVLLFFNYFIADYVLCQYNCWILDNLPELILIVLTIVLLIFYFLLIGNINRFYDPNVLLNKIIKSYKKHKNTKQTEDDFKDFTDVAKYILQYESEYNQQNQVYQFLYDYAVEKRENTVERRKNNGIIIYDDYFYDAVTNVNISLCTLEKQPISISNSNAIIELLLDCGDTNSLSDKKIYDVLWKNLKIQLFYDKDNWLYEYWAVANQHTLYLKPIFEGDNFLSGEEITQKDVDNRNKERTRFFELNYAFCSLLLYKKKYKLLNNILFYTDTMPADYPLTPSSLSQIIELYIKYSCEDYMGASEEKLAERYPFVDMKGIDRYDMTRYWIKQYFALLAVRLYQIQDNGRNIFGAPYIPTTLKEMNLWKRWMLIFKNQIEEITKDKQILKMLDIDTDFDTFVKGNGKNIIDILNKFIDDIKTSYKEGKANQPIDNDKKKEFYKKVNDLIIKGIPQFRCDIFKSKEENKTTKENGIKNFYINNHISRIPISTMFFSNDQDVGFVNYEEDISFSIISNYSREFADTFLITESNMVGYTIKYDDLFTAIDRLKIDNNFVIIAFNVRINNDDERLSKINNNEYRYKNIPFFNLSSGKSMTIDDKIFILRKEDCPYLEYKKLTEEDRKKSKLEIIDDNIKLYSSVIKLKDNEDLKNIYSNKIKASEIDNYSIVSIYLSSIIKWKQNIEMVCIDVAYQYGNNKYAEDINNVKPFLKPKITKND